MLQCSTRFFNDHKCRYKFVPKGILLGKRESTFGYHVYEHNNECRAIEVIGQDRSSKVVALFLEDRELARAALSCHTAMDLLCQEMRDACLG